jgi:hypothetical protein
VHELSTEQARIAAISIRSLREGTRPGTGAAVARARPLALRLSLTTIATIGCAIRRFASGPGCPEHAVACGAAASCRREQRVIFARVGIAGLDKIGAYSPALGLLRDMF